jgi:hypothetical protein
MESKDPIQADTHVMLRGILTEKCPLRMHLSRTSQLTDVWGPSTPHNLLFVKVMLRSG